MENMWQSNEHTVYKLSKSGVSVLCV